MKIQPYLVLDTETAGLNPEEDSILELAAIYDDGETVPNLQKFHWITSDLTTCHFSNDNANVLAMHIKNGLLQDIYEQTLLGGKSSLRSAFYNFLEGLPHPGSITLAGKNLASFDLLFLKAEGIKIDTFFKVNHRYIDTGSLYYSKFGYVPSGNEINALIERPLTSHRAVSDCEDVVAAIRYIMGK